MLFFSTQSQDFQEVVGSFVYYFMVLSTIILSPKTGFKNLVINVGKNVEIFEITNNQLKKNVSQIVLFICLFNK